MLQSEVKPEWIKPEAGLHGQKKSTKEFYITLGWSNDKSMDKPPHGTPQRWKEFYFAKVPNALELYMPDNFRFTHPLYKHLNKKPYEPKNNLITSIT